MIVTQVDAVGAYSILEIPFHARSLSMAGIGTADPKGQDVSAFNPALLALSGNESQYFYLSLLSHPAGIKSGVVEWRASFREFPVAITMRHVGYGDFTKFDDDGNRIGTYGAGDSWISAAASYPLMPGVAVGGSAGLLVSQVDDVSATLGLISIGTAINVPRYDLHVGLAVNNLGVTFSSFTKHVEAIPTSVAVGITKKLKYLPLELSVDGSWWSKEERGILRVGGEFKLPHDLYLRWGTSSYKLGQMTQNLYRDIITGTALGVGLKIDKLAVDLGINYGGVAGVIMGVGTSWRF
jgi:hypothetical protein